MTDDEKFRDHIVAIGRQALEYSARLGDPFLAQILAEYSGQFHQIGIAGGFEEFAAGCQLLLKQGKPIKTFIYTVDAYMLKTDRNYGYGAKVPGSGEGVVPGTLAKRFARGDQRVTEALNVTVIRADWAYFTTLPYERKGKAIHWRTTMTWDTQDKAEIQGRYPEMMLDVIVASQARAN